VQAQAGEPAHAGCPAARSVWWTWSAPYGGTVTLGTLGSDFDTVLAVYTGSALTGLTAVAGNDDGDLNHTSRLTFNAVAGVAYAIAVDGYAGGSGMIALNLSLAGTPGAPANDDFANAPALSGANVITNGMNYAASAQAGEPAHAGSPASRSVWYAWTAPAAGLARIATAGSDFDTVLGVYTGAAVNALALVAGDDQSGGNNTSLVQFNTVSGAVHRIAVDGYQGAQGNLVLSVQFLSGAAGNDNFAARAVLTGSNITVSAHNHGATYQIGEPWHAGNSPASSVWFNWVAPRTGPVTITTDGSAFDTLLAVYTGDTLESLFPVAANDDAHDLRTSTVQFDAIAGYRYQIAVDGYHGAQGQITLAGFMDTNDVTLMYTDFEGADLGADALMNSTYDWFGINTGGGCEGTVDNALAGQGRSAYLGYFAPTNGASYVAVYRPLKIDPTTDGRPLVGAAFNMAIVDSSTTDYDEFGFSFYNAAGYRLGRLGFDNRTTSIYYEGGDGIPHDTGVGFANGETYAVIVLVNAASNTWSAWLDDTLLFGDVSFNNSGRNRDIADVDIEWLIADANFPGDNYIVFDNLYMASSELPTPPQITSQPQPLSLYLGGMGSFQVGASGSQPLTFQWYKDSAPVSAATNAAIFLVNVDASLSADYRVVLANDYGSVTSQWAHLTVAVPPPSASLSRPALNDRGLQFQISGPAGHSYAVEASSNLTQWVELQTLINQNGTMLFLDPGATNQPCRFYRLNETY
jgi:hypothetical protein